MTCPREFCCLPRAVWNRNPDGILLADFVIGDYERPRNKARHISAPFLDPSDGS